LCSVVKNNIHTTAERVLQLSIVSHDRETRSRAGKTSLSALGAKYTITIISLFRRC
jgi:hypothetical protein